MRHSSEKAAPTTPADILLKCQETPTSIELFIQSISDRVLDLLPLPREAILGQPLSAFTALDEATVDEWVEFILRTCKLPYLNAYVQNDASHTLSYVLQYLSIYKDWVVVQIHFLKEDRQIGITFIPVDQFPERALLRQNIILKQRLSLRQHACRGGHWTIDVVRHLLFLARSSAALLALGDHPLVLPLQDYFSMVHPDDLPAIASALNQAGQSSPTIQNRVILSDGSVLRLNSCAAPIYDEENRLIRIFGYSEDITDQEEYTEKLYYSFERFVNMINHSSDLFLIVDAQFRYSYVSPGTLALTGLRDADLLGESAGKLLSIDQQTQILLESYKQLADATATSHIQCSIRGGDGLPRWFSLTLFSLFDDQNERQETIVFGNDITAERDIANDNAFLARHDSLTGLCNRATFWSEMESICVGNSAPFCLIVLDINGLKLVNNMVGQMEGDRVLIQVATMIRQSFAEGSLIARVGGDEYAVIVYDVDVEQIHTQCAALEALCEETNMLFLPISVSWGVACSIESGPRAQELFRLAETHMYEHKLIQKRSAHSQSLFSLKEALRARSMETSEHLVRMEKMVTALGTKLMLYAHDYHRLLLLAALHDVGKLGIPDEIIAKPGPLTDKEWAIMRTHCDIGYRIVLESPEMAGIAQEVLHHHERWDGSGYPFGLAGDQIPLLSQIIAIVDSYDVMTHRRVYKRAISHEDAVAELIRCRGTHFSPTTVDLFLDIFRSEEGEEMLRELQLGDAF